MKSIFLLFILTAVLLAAFDFGYIPGGSSNPADPSWDALYEQPYDFPNIANGIYVHSPQFGGADNFTLTSSYEVHVITFWTVFTGAVHPYDIAVDIYQDASGALGTHVWGETVPAAYQTETLTGDQSWGFDLYRSDLQLQTFPTIAAGDYWLVMSVLGATDPVGWLVSDPLYPPNMMQKNTTWGTVAYDGWFGLYDHDVSLSRTTWADIKSMY